MEGAEVAKGDHEPTLITSVRRALRLMETVAGHDTGAPAKLIAREAGLPLATTYHLLRTLMHEGYLRKLDDGAFVLGDALGHLTVHGREQAQLSRIRPTLAALRDELSAAAYLSLFTEGEIKCVEIVDSPRVPRVDLWVGFHEAGHATALGKCVLRQLPRGDFSEYVSGHPLVDLTPRTVTRSDELIRRLSAPGLLTLDLEEYSLGTACAAVPVSDGVHIGALAVSVPARRLGQITAAAGRLVATGQRVSRALSLTT